MRTYDWEEVKLKQNNEYTCFNRY